MGPLEDGGRRVRTPSHAGTGASSFVSFVSSVRVSGDDSPGRTAGMSLWERLRRRSRRGEPGPARPSEDHRVTDLTFEIGQVLWIQGRRGPTPWPERKALVERVLTGPRWGNAGYRWSAGDDECRVTDAAGNVLVKLRYEPQTNGHVVERYDDGRLVQRTIFDGHGRARA
jgi:hypothetical protein